MHEEEKLPRWIQQQCLWIVRGYEQNKAEWRRRRHEILNASAAPQDGSPRGALGESRTTEARAERLDRLERTLAFRQMIVVEHALTRVSSGLPRAMGKQLRAALMINCSNGRQWPYERLGLDGISRIGFYRFRNRFLYLIAEVLDLVS